MATKSAQEPSEPLKYQTWILKVSLHCDGCKRKVKKVLQSIDGVFTTQLDSQQNKVTVTGNVAVETLVRKLLKAGKHAEIWPESPAGKEKKSGRAKNKDKDSDPESGKNCNEQKEENPCETEEEKPSSVKDSRNKSAGKSPGNPPAGEESPAVSQKGSESEGGANPAANGGSKKKKRKGPKSTNNASSGLAAPLSNTPAVTGSESHDLGTNHHASQMNLSPPRPCKQGSYPQPLYVASYNRVHPSQSFGPSYYVPSSRYTYGGIQQEIYPVQATPLDSFEIFSEENANGCSIM